MALPLNFGPISAALAHLDCHIDKLKNQATNPKTSPTLAKTISQSCENLTFGIESIKCELETAQHLANDPNVAFEDTQSVYLRALEMAIELLIHHDDYEGYYKDKMGQNRKEGRNSKNSPNDRILMAVASILKQKLGRDLVGTDYPDWAQMVRDNHPTPPVVPKIRTSKQDGTPSNQLVPLEEDMQREEPWPESTLRKKFKEITGCTATKKK